MERDPDRPYLPLDGEQVARGLERAMEHLEQVERLLERGIEPPEYRCLEHDPDRETAHTLVGRGWWPLVDEAFDIAATEGVRIAAVREKLGVLRISWAGHRPEQRERLRSIAQDLTARSSAICEACGAPGHVRIGEFFWRKALCDGCAALRAAGRSWAEVFGFQPYCTPLN
jgi:hypothetical protein